MSTTSTRLGGSLGRLSHSRATAASRASVVGTRARPFSSTFDISANDLWKRDLVLLSKGVQVRQEATDWEKAIPYGMGAVVWDSAVAFCRLLDALEADDEAGSSSSSSSSSFWQQRRVLELGAGCGASGLSAAARGARVTLTDKETLLPLLHRNAELNPTLDVTVTSLRWDDVEASDFYSAEGSLFDIVLATDVVEVDPDRRNLEAPFQALRRTLECMLRVAPRALCLIVFEERGPLTLSGLGALFSSLADEGELWEYELPDQLAASLDGRKKKRASSRAKQANRLRFLMLHRSGAGSLEGSAAAAWRSLLEKREVTFRRWLPEDFEEE